MGRSNDDDYDDGDGFEAHHARIEKLLNRAYWIKLIKENWSVIHEDVTFDRERKKCENEGKPWTAEHVYRSLVLLLAGKVNVGFVRLGSVRLECRAGAPYTVVFQGQTYEGVVSGLTRFTCDAVMPSGTPQKVFTKFVSHPFYQYGRY